MIVEIYVIATQVCFYIIVRLRNKMGNKKYKETRLYKVVSLIPYILMIVVSIIFLIKEFVN